MRLSFTVAVFVLLFLTSALPCFAGEDIDDLLYSGIADKRVTKDGLLELLSEIQQKLTEQKNDYTLNWMYAALNYFYGDFYAEKANEKKRYFTFCKEYAEKAVGINRGGIAGHYWLGVGLAKWAEYNGILYSLFTADDILNEMNIVIKLNPVYFHGLPYAIRASVYAMAPGVISVGNWEKAREDIITALAQGKNYRPVFLIVANIYIHWGEWENARKMIEEGLKLPFDQRQLIEETDCIAKLTERQSQVDTELAKRKK